MNKLFTKLAKVFLGLSLVAGVGVAVGSNREAMSVQASTATAAYVFTDKNYNGKLNGTTYTLSSTLTSVTAGGGFTSGQGIQHVANASSGATTVASYSKVTKITVYYCTNASKGAGTIGFKIGSGTRQTFPVTRPSSGGTTQKSYDFTFSEETGVVTVDCSATANSVYLYGFTITYDDGQGGDLTPIGAPTISVSGTVVSWTNISGNAGYTYSITGTASKSGDLAANTTSLDVSTLGLAYGSYSITITTKGDGTSTSNSSASNSVSFTLAEPTFSGTFNKVTGTSLTEGDFVLTYQNYVLGNVLSSNKIQNSSQSFTSGASSITNPVVSAVWHIAPSGDYYTLYNAAIDQYLKGTSGSNTNIYLETLNQTLSDDSKWVLDNSTADAFDFICHSQSTRALRTTGSGWGSYAKSNNGGKLTLYKKHVAYTIQYDANTGSGTMANSETIVSSCTFTAPSATKEFDHWSTSSTDQGTSYNPGDSVTSSCTLYAIWKDKVASVAVDKSSIVLEIGGSSTTVQATPTNIDNPSYSWARFSGDDCISLTNATSSTVTVSVANGVTSSATCVLRVTVSGTLGDNSVSRTADVDVSVTKTSSQSNPYTVAEAVPVATAQGGTEADTLAYVRGYLAIKNSTGSQIFLTDDPDSIDITKTYSDAEKQAMLCVYKSGGVTDISSVNVGDQVLISGYPVLYNGNQPEFASGTAISYVAETMTLTKTVSEESLKVNSSFSYSGTVGVNYTHKTDAADVTASVTYSGYDMSSTGSQTVTISYTDSKLNKTATTTYTLSVYTVTVTDVTGVASHPTEVYQNGSIDPSDVILNVTYSDSTTGTVAADSVSVDATAITNNVTATATYNAATGTKTATFLVNVIKEPVWDYLVDTIDNGQTSSYLGSTGTTTWGSDFNLEFSSGSKYYIHSMGTTGTSNALQFNKNGYLYASKSGGIAYSISIKGTSGNKVDIYGSNSAYSVEPTGGALEQMTLNGSTAVTYSFTDDYEYIAVHGVSSGTSIIEVVVTWKIEGAENPLIANPVLSPNGSASVAAGKSFALTVTTNPIDSDEKLVISSSDLTKVSVSGSGREFTIRGVATTSSPVTVTVAGAKGIYQSTISITVTEPEKTYDDKILTVASLGIGSSYDTDTSNDYVNDDVAYTCYNVLNNTGIQFKSGTGYIANKEELYSGANNTIKSITLVMDSSNTSYITAFEGTSPNPSTDVPDLVDTWTNTGVNTYTFSSGMTYFKLLASGTAHVRQIIIELEDNADSILAEARLAALSILTDLSGNCGDDGSGVVTQSEWNKLCDDLDELDLSSDAKLFLKNAPRILLGNLSQGGAEIENAMAHYDACVTKFGFTPDTALTNARASNRVSTLLGFTEKPGTVAIIVIISMVSMTAIGGYFFLRKRKENN